MSVAPAAITANGYDSGAWSALLQAVYDVLVGMDELEPSSAPFNAQRLPATRTGPGKRAFCLWLAASEDTGERQRHRAREGHTFQVLILSSIKQAGGWLESQKGLLDAAQAIRDALLDPGDDSTSPVRLAPLAGWGPRWESCTHEEVDGYVVTTIQLAITGISFPSQRQSAGVAA